MVSFLFSHAQAQELETVGIPSPWQLGFQEFVTPVGQLIDDTHSVTMFMMMLVALGVLGLMGYIIYAFREKKHPKPSTFTHNLPLEIIWTILPVVILIIVGIPSFRAIYAQHRLENAEMTIKITGYQWYWTYQYPDHNDILLVSLMIPESRLKADQHRLLDVDAPMVLPVDTKIRLQITAGDVLHAFAVPAFALKMDAVPGRLNETWVQVTKEGVYYGQCSELCGAGHGYMPIVIHAVSKEAFQEWIEARSS